MGKFRKMIDLSTDEKKKSFFELLDSKKSMEDVYKEFGLKYSHSNSSDLHKMADLIGFDLNIYKERQAKQKKYCLHCGRELVSWQTKFCSNSCSATYNNLKRCPMPEESKKLISEKLKNYYNIPINRINLSKSKVGDRNQYNDDLELIRICKYCGEKFIVNKKSNGRYSNATCCSEECKRKYLSKNSKDKKCGGLKEGSAKSYKHGWYKNIYCDSSWELAFVLWHFDNNIEIKRSKEVRKYKINDIEYNFYPDFEVNNKIYEIKGIKNEISDAKQLYNNDIIFLYRKDMEIYLKYARDKYGRDFIKLYDKL